MSILLLLKHQIFHFQVKGTEIAQEAKYAHIIGANHSISTVLEASRSTKVKAKSPSLFYIGSWKSSFN